ncbi:uncharacterized protein LOC121258762 [Juglans microcarpa x Juglans regia]|uniref:uncharacterized protein LOC121258762 n=1 Tax=Juglans microcarpa x Juglans regia TaxID=2249226 RepID=UPI001B7E3173|nr:uncharacterized protein LOC121258762 [Juglans microcarpa x Juglans regia]
MGGALSSTATSRSNATTTTTNRQPPKPTTWKTQLQTSPRSLNRRCRSHPKGFGPSGDGKWGGRGRRGECGFCLFMKAGGCKESFIAWEQCIEKAEKMKEDIVEKCVEVTGALKKCMEAHADYYEPILRAEKMAEEEAIRELDIEKEKEREASSEGS